MNVDDLLCDLMLQCGTLKLSVHHHDYINVPRKKELRPSLGVPTAKVEPTRGPEMDDNHDQP